MIPLAVTKPEGADNHLLSTMRVDFFLHLGVPFRNTLSEALVTTIFHDFFYSVQVHIPEKKINAEW